ncbi:MAG TPA: hypothetical protein VFN40_13640 [Gemmatimonadales bacterium]|nr:hypothetical protein [Gemmatimonadales bacterium]
MTREQWRSAPLVLLVGVLAADWQPEDCPDCFHEGYRIDMSAAPVGTAPPPAVLFSGYRNGRCRDDLICTGAPDAWFGDLDGAVMNWWSSCGDQDREMVVFAGGHAPTVLHPAAGSTDFTPTLDPPATLSIAAWVEGADPSLASDPQVQPRVDWATLQLEMTQQIFDDLGAGIKLDFSVNTLPGTLPTDVSAILDDADCDLAAKLTTGATGNPALAAMQASTSLNVYFVNRIHYMYDGVTCFGDANPTSTRYVIFMAELQHAPSTLAHEIGHALGLVGVAALPGGASGSYAGDVNELKLDPYLGTDNLMFSGVTDVGQITVGEIYRMHFDKRSWLWGSKSAAGGYPRECQADPVAGGPCPPLTLHPTRGWP